MPLTDMEIGAAPELHVSDGGGLQLWIMPDGAKRWRFAYRLAGAQKALAIGVYPAPQNHCGAKRPPGPSPGGGGFFESIFHLRA